MNDMSHVFRKKRKKNEHTDAALAPWYRLTNAIVIQAVRDYRKAQARIRINPDNSKPSEKKIEELEEFFLSPWFKTLTDTDGLAVLLRLREEAAQ